MGQERGERLLRDTMERGWGLLLEVVLAAGDEEERVAAVGKPGGAVGHPADASQF